MNIQDAIRNLRDSPHTVTFMEMGGKIRVAPYSHLFHDAMVLLGALQRYGVRAGDRVSLEVGSLQNIVTALWACWLGCIVPVIMPVEFGRYGICAEKFSLCDGDGGIALGGLPLSFGAAGEVRRARDGEVAMLQYTSGSAGAPRKVALTGANLWEGALASSVVVRPGKRERYLSWLPMRHIFGLVGYHLVPLFNDFDQFLIDTGEFLKKPSLWLEQCCEWGCTVTGATQFGLERVSAVVQSDARLDLGSVNVCFCGGDNLKVSALLGFEEKVSAFGWRKGVLCPAYGMTEATMGIAYKPPGEAIRVDRIDPQSVTMGKEVEFIGDSPKKSLLPPIERVSLGILDDCNRASVRDEDGRELPGGHLGVIHLKGGNICAGYEPPSDPPNPDAEGWLDTGDVGYFKNGRVTLLARRKEVICRNGLNYPLPDMEECARGSLRAGLALVETSCGLVMFVERCGEEEVREASASLARGWNVPVRAVVLIDEIPKTPKGTADRLELAIGWEKGLYAPLRAASCEDAALAGDETKMARIWAGILGVPPEALAPSSNFAELGGDSLSLFDLAAAIEREWGVYVETADLKCAPTLREATALLLGNRLMSFSEKLNNP
ncbi:MAG: non-ribosomal peptide synthetase [Synergistaceae bacterium]|jgi:acyl-CoA synthetase (AMP-forming)/AMP-acid ligase II/acyl carrier protein|nr:non-ribosomal peptide synthetase [Synergistaceae bacterium]